MSQAKNKILIKLILVVLVLLPCKGIWGWGRSFEILIFFLLFINYRDIIPEYSIIMSLDKPYLKN